MENMTEMKVGNLVAKDYRYADVFKKYGIDFCCGGGISIAKACEKNRVDQQALLHDLESITKHPVSSDDANNWELDKLIDHIVDIHHRYVLENLPLIHAYAEKVSRVHGDRHPELNEIFEKFLDLKTDLTAHMGKEENVLFPYIKSLINNPDNAVKPPFGSVQNPIAMMVEEHDTAGAIMKQIAELSNHYQPPADACTTYQILFKKLEEFEKDLHRHVHLENNILFPKAVELEPQS